MARPTDEKKDDVVKVRISPELHEQIKDRARRKCVSVSEYIRDTLKQAISQNPEK